ncbi:hypothetical protein GCM10010430_52380 [Kitasatospora cystarginea]|uniref:Uncharacterized protein n=1 Tax=Kitasatospora cystarginea TaxID=58350 RepID=A0ABN3EKE8_9ACTN
MAGGGEGGARADTYAGYADCVERDPIPAFGRYRLPDLRPKQIDDPAESQAWLRQEQEAARPVVSAAVAGMAPTTQPLRS